VTKPKKMGEFTEFVPVDRPRKTPGWGVDDPITCATYARLCAALEHVYPGKWRRSVDVCPVAVNKTIDNETDALETIKRIEARLKQKGRRNATVRP
jgi:hypothetical protein